MTTPKAWHLPVILALGLLVPDVAAADLTSTLRRAISAGAGISDDIPAKSFRPAAKQLDTAAPGRKVDIDLARSALRSADADLLRQIDELPPAERQFALEVFEGGQALRSANPDELARARLVAEGGTDLLVAAQRHGEDAVKPAFMMQLAEGAGQVPPGSVARYAQISVERGEPFIAGWNKYIVPNWKALASGGAISACLVASETCIDAAGNLTSLMSETLARLGVEVVTGAVTGAAKGAGEAAVDAAKGTDGVWFAAGLAALLLTLLLVRRIRSAMGQLSHHIFGGLTGTSKSAPTPSPPPSSPRPDIRRPRRSLRDRDI